MFAITTAKHLKTLGNKPKQLEIMTNWRLNIYPTVRQSECCNSAVEWNGNAELCTECDEVCEVIEYQDDNSDY